MAPRTQRTRHNWTSDDIALLGTMPDADAATRIGVSAAAVGLKRQALNIPRYGRAAEFKRPPADPESARTERIQIRLSKRELEGFSAAAVALKLEQSELARALLLAVLPPNK